MSSSTVSWKPECIPSLIPTLVIDGASAALAWYCKIYEAESSEVMQSGSRLQHACITLPGGGKLFINDPMPTMGFPASVCNLYLYVPDVDAVFKTAVQAGAASKREPVDQFWGDRSGLLVDPFGISWTLATQVKKVSQAEVEEAGRAWAARLSQNGSAAAETQ